MKHLVSPSLLAADFSNLQSEIEMLNKSDADWIHLDIMDGNFVPNISFGIPVLESIKKYKEKPFDVHLMIENPDQYIEAFKKAGADIYNVHYEACRHLHRTIGAIHAADMQAGVTLNPHTPVALLDDIISDVELVLLMSVNPGFGGQKYIPNTFLKVEQLKELILKKNSKALIQVDGGVDASNAKQLIAKGADCLVAGSYIFKTEDPIKTIAGLKNLDF